MIRNRVLKMDFLSPEDEDNDGRILRNFSASI